MDRLCTYCGSESPNARDHVIPASFLGFRCYDDSIQWIVPSCETCNKLAGSKVFFCIPDKAKYIHRRYKSRFAKLLRTPFWSDEELKSIDYSLRSGIREKMIAKIIVQRKMEYLKTVSNYSEDYLMPNFIKLQIEQWIKQFRRRSRKKK